MKIFSIFTLTTFSVLSAHAMSIDDFLNEVVVKNKSIAALNLSVQAAELKKQQGDLELSPLLTLSGGYLTDKKTQANSPTYIINQQKVRDYSLGLGKKFSTGTKAQLTLSSQDVSIQALNPPPATLYNNQVGIASAEVSLSQSLWKDGWGKATDLRRERELYVSELEKEAQKLKLKQSLIQAESDYWQHIYLLDEVKIRKASLDRAKKIESWVKRRLDNGIGDRSDLLNAQGLVANREIQLLNSEDDLLASERKIRDWLEINNIDKLPFFKSSLDMVRDLNKMPSGKAEDKNVIRIDSYLAVLESKLKKVVSQEVEENLKPELNIVGSYKTNSFEGNASEANQKITNNEKPTSYVGFQFKWLLDGDIKDSTITSAKLDAESANEKMKKLKEESDSSWSELFRRHLEMSKRIELTERLSKIQTAKARTEQDKLSKGRTITSQVITAEQDAAEAESLLNKLKSEQRKLESQARNFIKVGNL
jgi:outer membrane protein TolC